MELERLEATARQMVAPGRGILAMDESTATCTARFDKLGVASTEENRLSYRQMLVTAPGISDYISGAILFDETIRQKVKGEVPFASYLDRIGIVPGIKVDKGAKVLAGHSSEKVTEGLDGLRERLEEYVTLGARFAKWRAVITIGDGIPTDACIMANAHALARYAALCQEAGVVPIVEPEVLMDGTHDIATCRTVTETTLGVVYEQLHQQGVVPSGTVLKPNMVLSGMDCAQQASVDEVAEQTVDCLRATVPCEVAGIAFLSGGQTDEKATLHLNRMNQLDVDLPWPLTFSYGRALQQAPMKAWSGDNSRQAEVHGQALRRAMVNAYASRGEYTSEMDGEAA
ncbi:MAG: fructose-bisphosphate aldolase class I [Acidiferrobacterales bacterium]|nr:fructose-bisphosphate aldolase class I [Acidiferrobacterales bacterium]